MVVVALQYLWEHRRVWGAVWPHPACRIPQNNEQWEGSRSCGEERQTGLQTTCTPWCFCRAGELGCVVCLLQGWGLQQNRE